MKEQIKIGPLTIECEPRFDGKAFASTVAVGPASCGGPPLALGDFYALGVASRAASELQRQLDRRRSLARRPRESLNDYKVRLQIAIDKHLSDCDACNYDRDCTACAAGDGSEPDDMHACNCGAHAGYGYQLHDTLQIVYVALKAEGNSP
jgi:hypothetical protein